MRGRSTPRTGAAFTLIELLVVIAIIAILAAILFPVFAQAREKARQTACLSNTKQIGTGIMMYTQDYDETLPGAAYGGVPGTSVNDLQNPKWMDVIQPYVKNDQMFNCPSDSGKKYVSLSTNPARTGGTNPPGGSYLLNSAYWSGTAQTSPAGLAMASIEQPADTIYASEGVSVVNNQFYWSNGAAAPALPLQPLTANNSFGMDTKANPPYFGYQDSSGRKYLFAGRHSGLGNIVFCDGHAKAMQVSKVAETHNVNGRDVFYWFTNQAD